MTSNNILFSQAPFLQNKYNLLYFKIISKARNENRKKRCGVYYESHHILPKSMGGNDTKENLVLLTGREHFVCHWLLTKFSQGKEREKMIFAFWGMRNINKENQKRYINSRAYNYLKEEYSKIAFSAASKIVKLNGGPWNKGKKMTDEARKKMSESAKNRPPIKEETRVKLSEIKKGKKLTEEHIKNIRSARIGIKHSEEAKKKMSGKKIGKPSWNKGISHSEKHKEALRKAWEKRKSDKSKLIA